MPNRLTVSSARQIDGAVLTRRARVSKSPGAGTERSGRAVSNATIASSSRLRSQSSVLAIPSTLVVRWETMASRPGRRIRATPAVTTPANDSDEQGV